MLRFASIIIAVLALAIAPVAAQQATSGPLNVVATFSILGDFAKNIGGERVSVTTLVGPNSDTHVYTPTPSDAKKIAGAKLVIVNGLGLEGWLPRLVKSSGSKGFTIIATKGIATRKIEDGHDHGPGDADPHAWQSVVNAKAYVTNIRDALTAADPAGADAYKANAVAYLAKLDVLDREIREAVAKIPPQRRSVISTHDAFGYFAAAYGIKFIAPQGVSTESEPSARDIAAIITQIDRKSVV